MGDSFLLTVRRHQVLPKTNAVLHQAPWYRHKGKRKGKNSKRLCIHQKNSHSLRNKCLGEGWGELPGVSDFLDPAISKVPGPLSTVMNTSIPSLKMTWVMFLLCSMVGTDPSTISRMGSSRAMPGDGCSWGNYGLGRGGLMRLQSQRWQLGTSQLWVRVRAWSSPWNSLAHTALQSWSAGMAQSLPKLPLRSQLSLEVVPRYGTRCF